MDTQATSYDIFSLLHYPQEAFSKAEDSPTIRAINPKVTEFGMSGAMTATDVVELNLHYGCPDIDSRQIVHYIHEVEYRTMLERSNLDMELTKN